MKEEKEPQDSAIWGHRKGSREAGARLRGGEDGALGRQSEVEEDRVQVFRNQKKKGKDRFRERKKTGQVI